MVVVERMSKDEFDLDVDTINLIIAWFLKYSDSKFRDVPMVCSVVGVYETIDRMIRHNQIAENTEGVPDVVINGDIDIE